MRHVINTWFAERLGDSDIYAQYLEDHHPAHMPCIEIRRLDWANTAEVAKRLGMRLVAVWAVERMMHDVSGADDAKLYSYMAFAHPEHRHALVRTELHADEPEIHSVSSHYIAAYRMERTMQDMFAIKVLDLADSRLWIKHEHWPVDAHPLRHSFNGKIPLLADAERQYIDYDYVACDSEYAYEIPVGPVHAGIIEPGHFRFLAVGEHILNMEARLGYVHKGIEKAMQGKSAMDGISLAGRVSGDSTVAYAWAFAHACEYAATVKVSSRASYLRGVLCERERMANHIGDIGAICNDAGFVFMHVQCLRLREDMARLHHDVFAHRLLMDSIVVGGVACDVNVENRQKIIQQTTDIALEVERLRDMYADTSSIQQRVIGAGTVSVEDALDLGLLGYAGRASGHCVDERIEEAYAPYDSVEVGVARGKHGDVAARVWVRFEEIADSARIIIKLLEDLPVGDIQSEWLTPEAGVSGFSSIEGWRGEVATWIRFENDGKIDRYFVRDPSAINWLGLELAVRTVPVPDFPLVNKSFNGSYSGNDL